MNETSLIRTWNKGKKVNYIKQEKNKQFYIWLGKLNNCISQIESGRWARGYYRRCWSK